MHHKMHHNLPISTLDLWTRILTIVISFLLIGVSTLVVATYPSLLNLVIQIVCCLISMAGFFWATRDIDHSEDH